MKIKENLYLTLKFPFEFMVFKKCWYIEFKTAVSYVSDDVHWSFAAQLFGFGFELFKVKKRD